MKATGASAEKSWISAAGTSRRPAYGKTRSTERRNATRSRIEEVLVDRADRGAVDLPPAVVGQQAVLLALDVGQLRPHEPGDVPWDLLDDRLVRAGEVVRVPVDEVAGAGGDAAELADPERDVVATLL